MEVDFNNVLRLMDYAEPVYTLAEKIDFTKILDPVKTYVMGNKKQLKEDYTNILKTRLTEFLKINNNENVFYYLQKDVQNSENEYILTDEKQIIQCIMHNNHPSIIIQKQSVINCQSGILQLEIKDIDNDNTQCEIECSFTPKNGIKKTLQISINIEDNLDIISTYKEIAILLSQITQESFEQFKKHLNTNNKKLSKIFFSNVKKLISKILEKNEYVHQELMLSHVMNLVQEDEINIRAIKK